MTTITCPRCNTSFETAARTSTRCRKCRAVVRVPAGARDSYWGIGLLLGCGHLSGYYGEDVDPAEADRYLFTCDECGAKDQEVRRVVGSVTQQEAATMTEEAIAEVLFGAPAAS